jgi:NAD(P)H-hydrate epimerase
VEGDVTPLDHEAGKSAILLGPGCDENERLCALLTAFLTTEGAPLILDAGAINALAAMGETGRTLLKNTRRAVVLTPHPAEMARLFGSTTKEVQARRLPLARRFASEYPVTLVLKGAGTVIASCGELAVNLTGGPALAKGGSGDILAGAIASLIASGLAPFAAARLAVCLHGAAGDRLAARYSPLGVRPSDLPAEMAAIAAEATV